MIETKRLFIKPLNSKELRKYAHTPKELAIDLGLNPSNIVVKEEPQNAVLVDLIPNIEDASKDYLFNTMWIIIEKNKKEIIGGICFHGDPDEYGEVEIGYGTDEAYWNKGVMTETIAGLIEWAKSNVKIKSIKAKTDNQNFPSIKVLEKNNFKIDECIDEFVILRLKLDQK